MIIGSGLLARAFSYDYLHRDDICVFAAGVSNSSCTDFQEFKRERQRLIVALLEARNVDEFVYFGTCSVLDPDAVQTPYVQHKLEMEQLVRSHERSLILRLPQVAGRTPNPHTLLNYLFARISRSESFTVWNNARRNIIDIEDVVSIANWLIVNNTERNLTYNIANLINYSMGEIVAAIENVLGKPALYEAIEKGSEYLIDTTAIMPALDKTCICFENDYLKRVLFKYYG